MAIVTSNQITFIDNTNTQQYLYIRYSDDGGENFTNNDGLDSGAWLGTCVTTSAIAPSDLSEYTWKKIVGEAGKDGVDGAPGTSTYFYVRYSSSDNGSSMTETPQSDSEYLGVCSTTKSIAPTSPDEYTWSLIKGANGQNGSPGAPGDNGQTSYLHIKYSNDGINFTEPNGEIIGKYIGTYVDFEEADSPNPNNYKWKKFVGEDGLSGASVNLLKTSNEQRLFQDSAYGYIDYELTTSLKPSTTYTLVTCAKFDEGVDKHSVYVTTKNNTPSYAKLIFDENTGDEEIIITVFTSTSSNADKIRYRNTASEKSGTIYWCALYEGEVNAPQVWMPSSAEAVGTTYYTWIRYADDAKGTNINNLPDGKSYIGIAYNKETSVESENPTDYTWSLIKGVDGQNGDPGNGIANIVECYLVSDKDKGITKDDFDWDDTTIPTMDSINKYLWNCEKTTFTNGDSTITEPIVIGTYSADGQDGRGILSITNHYGVSSDPSVKPTDWKYSISDLDIDVTDKYIWNFETIEYTDGDIIDTVPAIISINGENAITLNFITPNGCEFKEGIESITLNTLARNGYVEITSGATYLWYYNDNGVWRNITDDNTNTTITTKNLTINKGASYAKSTIKCVMRYNGVDYENSVVLSENKDIYTAAISFMNGTNLLRSADKFILGYVSLYCNNEEVDVILSDKYYDGEEVTVTNNVITATNMDTKEIFNGQYLYFVYQQNGIYKIILGQYNGSSWNVVNPSFNYLYNSNFDTSEKVFIIPRNDILKTKTISFDVYKKLLVNNNQVYDNTTLLASISANIIDLNDPIISPNAPEDPREGQLWLNNTKFPNELQMWDGTGWIKTSGQKGNTIHTSIPLEYDIGDLWVLGQNEVLTITAADGTSTEYQQGDTLKAQDTNVGFITEAAGNGQTQIFETNSFYGGVRVFIDEVEQLEGWSYSLITGTITDANEISTTTYKGRLTFTTAPIGKIIIRKFNNSDWVDVDPDATVQKRGIKQNFNFHTDSGLTIGDSNKFSVQIKGDNMSFHRPDGNSVVTLGVDNATIRNAIFEGNKDTVFNNNLMIDKNSSLCMGPLFKWIVESDGSLSLVTSYDEE